jgi:NDP-sugar pyrophosphorylase family protein
VNRAARTFPPAVILAAGESSRFWPLSTHGHKSLHRLRGRAVIEHTVGSLAAAGVTEILIVQSPIARAAHFPHRTIADQLGDGQRYGVTLRYLDQSRATGPGPALRLATAVLDGPYFVVYPESINAGELLPELWAAREGAAAVVAGQEQEETWLFGVFALDGDMVTNVVEKPEPGSEPSRVCNMAVGLFTPEYSQVLAQQPDEEIANITALRELAQRRPVRVVRTSHPFFPLKYPWHLFAMAEHLAPGGHLADDARVADTAEIGPGCLIESDAVIGPGIRLEQCLIGAGSQVAASLRDTILGAAAEIQAGAVVEDTPLAAGIVSVDIKGHAINTGLARLGATIGQGTVIEAGARVGPGLLLGAESRVPPGLSLRENLPDRTVAGEG